jgi:3D (Asp-Asp-Asp) domain-containing protein
MREFSRLSLVILFAMVILLCSGGCASRGTRTAGHDRRMPAARASANRANGSYNFNGRRIRPGQTVMMEVTAYSPDPRSCGKWADGITASGQPVTANGGRLVAADTRYLPFGTVLTVEGYAANNPVPVLDRGGAIKGNRLDVLFPNHELALQWGRRQCRVTVWEYVN